MSRALIHISGELTPYLLTSKQLLTLLLYQMYAALGIQGAGGLTAGVGELPRSGGTGIELTPRPVSIAALRDALPVVSVWGPITGSQQVRQDARAEEGDARGRIEG